MVSPSTNVDGHFSVCLFIFRLYHIFPAHLLGKIELEILIDQVRVESALVN